MLVVMELHRFRVDGRLERVVAEPPRRLLHLGPRSGARPSRYHPTALVNERRGGGIALERYDLVIVGGGAAGINALKTAVTLKAKVAVVDRGPLGGTCVNRG
jgi:hypothetical protein